jgi:hypothetical protein
MKPPAFGQPAAAAPASHAAETQSLDPFEEAFPSFEELYNESEPLEKAPPTKKLPAPPPSLPAAAVATEPAPKSPPADDEFAIPMPPLPDNSPGSRKVEFPSLGTAPASTAKSPFPQAKPSGGRIFGTPPQKPGSLPAAGTSAPGGGAAAPRMAEEDPLAEGDFSPLPLVKSQSAPFEPLTPKKSGKPPVADYFDSAEGFGPEPGLGESRGARSQPRPPAPAAPDEQPSLPPARLSRISAPQLLRRQRGGTPPADPFNR